jgi:ATP-binding cassette subfamily C protein
MIIAKKIFSSFSLIPKLYKKRYLFLVALQVSLPIFDVVGIVMLGILLQKILVVGAIDSEKNLLIFEKEIMQLLNLDQRQYLLLLALTSAILFITKGIFSVIVNSTTYRFLSKVSLDFSSDKAGKFFNADLATVQRLPSARVGAALNDAINFKIVGVLGAFGSLIGEIMLVVSVCIFLFIYNGIITTISIIYFLVVFVFLQKSLSNKTSLLAHTKTKSDENIRTLIHESIASYRELFVIDAMEKMLHRYGEERKRAADAQATLYWVVNLPKYVYESVLIVGTAVLIGLTYLLSSSDNFQLTIATFFIAGVRVLPSILRIQNLLNLIDYASSSTSILDEVLELESNRAEAKFAMNFSLAIEKTPEPQFVPSVEIVDLVFSHSDDERFELSIDALQINSGERIALVGESGSGKSTFADLLLGILEPKEGTIKLSNLNPAESIQTFPGKIGYVPQAANLFSTDIFGNIALYEKKTAENIKRAWECLERAQLASLVSQLPDGLDTLIGERGHKLSGGQKQRLSLARALFPEPGLLVLDEATSALDAEVENDIRNAIESLDSKTTVIVIAHRLSTVKTFDRFLFFENGKIIGDGPFSFLRSKIKKFDRQVVLSFSENSDE